MGDREEEEELQMALRMSLQGSPPPPEPKRSKPPPAGGESPEAEARRIQRELMAAAAEKRLRASVAASPALTPPPQPVAELKRSLEATKEEEEEKEAGPKPTVEPSEEVEAEEGEEGEELPPHLADELFGMVFGCGVSKAVLAQWSNQGIRFSSDPETTMGLVQLEGGPCGVLAAVQAYVLKYLLFFPDDLGNPEISNPLYTLGQRRFYQSSFAARDDFSSMTDDRKLRALVHGMVEILFLCGTGKRAVLASLKGFSHGGINGCKDDQKIDTVLGSISVESAMDLQKILRINTYTSRKDAFNSLLANIPVFQSRLGAMLFLISALLSRGLESIQEDRDDPSQPLVTAPFGHASQEIVNLLLCGEAVPNVFDGKMDLGGGMSLKGIPKDVEVGFLTLLESLNLCKVGQYLKCPKWPIWVVGSESHYTVLFALNPNVQEENELEARESKIRRAFDTQDQSGGGGFISVEGFQQVLRDTCINFPSDKLEDLCSAGIIVWSEFWQALLQLDKRAGGLKDPTGLMGKKQFTIYHFNGIAKSVLNGNANPVGSTPVQRPRLCKLNVSVPPRWTQDEYLADVVNASTSGSKDDSVLSLAPSTQTSQHAPLVDCIRTRWPRASCSWVGDAPSIV